MKPSLTERTFLIYTIIAVLMLLVIHAFHPQISSHYNPKNFLGLHTALEFFAISISFSIFLYGWRRFEYTRSGKLLMVSLVFFTVGSIDMFHTLTFKGMPFFLTESSVAKATWFWVIARIIEAISMLFILILPDKKLEGDPRKLFLTTGIFIVIFFVFVVFSYEDVLPLLVIEGEGTTFLKNMMEYFISFLQMLSIVLSLLLYNERKSHEHLYLALAFTLLFLSELIFTIYQSVYDIDNLSGHVFKVVGFYFILKGFYFSIEKETFSQNYFRRTRCLQPCELVREHQGIIFTVIKDGDVFIHQTCNGELLNELDLSPDKIVGKTLREIELNKASSLEGHYQRCWESGTNVTYRVLVKNKSLYVSLKPLFKDDMISEILGSVIDLTAIEESSKLNYYGTQLYK
jgi:hypothetical protein